MMGKRDKTPSTLRSGIKHSTTSARPHAASSRTSDWLWFVIALLVVAAIYLI